MAKAKKTVKKARFSIGKLTSKKKLGLFVLLFAIIGGLIVLRQSFASSPTTCYYGYIKNTCETTHSIGRVDSRVWPAAWYASDYGLTDTHTMWHTYFKSQEGYSSAPSGNVFHYCIELEANSPNVDTDYAFDIYGQDSAAFGTIDSNYSINNLKFIMKSKANGSYMEAESASGIRGVVCGNIKGSAGNQSFPVVGAQVLGANVGASLLVNYVQMQRL